MSAPYWQFGTLPIRIFCQFGLKTAWDISYDILLSPLKFVNFWQLQAIRVFGQIWMSSENQSFLDERVTGLRCDFTVLSSQITRLYDGTITGGCNGHVDHRKNWNWKVAFFQYICDGLKVLGIYWFHQESVHRCSLGISDLLAILWAIKCQFFDTFWHIKNYKNFYTMGIRNFDPTFGMKVSIYLTRNKKKSEFFDYPHILFHRSCKCFLVDVLCPGLASDSY